MAGTDKPQPAGRLPFGRDVRQTTNGGLTFDKMFNAWRKDWSLSAGGGDKGNDKDSPIREWLDTLGRHPHGDADALTLAHQRHETLFKACGARCIDLKTEWRLTLGLGRSHPSENGFTWHHTLATPYIPASSIKGVVRGWATDWADADPCLVTLLLGTEPDTADGREVTPAAGALVFFDALPLRPVLVATDHMTPHFQDYYMALEGDVPAPGDWLSPNPIPFLTVDPETTFRFAVAIRRGAPESGVEDAAAVGLQWLREALENVGIGAKTAVGYGRFVPLAAEPEMPDPFAVGRRVVDRGGEYGSGRIVTAADADGRIAVHFDHGVQVLDRDDLAPA